MLYICSHSHVSRGCATIYLGFIHIEWSSIPPFCLSTFFTRCLLPDRRTGAGNLWRLVELCTKCRNRASVKTGRTCEHICYFKLVKRQQLSPKIHVILWRGGKCVCGGRFVCLSHALSAEACAGCRWGADALLFLSSTSTWSLMNVNSL